MGLYYGAPGEIRTPDRLVRSQVLYPTELRAREAFYYLDFQPALSTKSSGGERGIRTLDGAFDPILP